VFSIIRNNSARTPHLSRHVSQQVGQRLKLEVEVVQEPAVGDPAAVVPTAAPHDGPPPPPSPPSPPPVSIADAPLAPPIVDVCLPLGGIDCVFEVCGVNAVQGVGLSFRRERGGGRWLSGVVRIPVSGPDGIRIQYVPPSPAQDNSHLSRWWSEYNLTKPD